MTARWRYFLLNHQGHPLEIQLAGGVLLVGARMETEVTRDVVESELIRTLQRQRLVTVRECVEEVSLETEPATGAKRAKPARKRPTVARKKE